MLYSNGQKNILDIIVWVKCDYVPLSNVSEHWTRGGGGVSQRGAGLYQHDLIPYISISVSAFTHIVYSSNVLSRICLIFGKYVVIYFCNASGAQLLHTEYTSNELRGNCCCFGTLLISLRSEVPSPWIAFCFIA